MKPLKLVHPRRAPGPKIAVGFAATDRECIVRFEVAGADPVVNPDLSREESAHGLWDWDVVEVFIAHPTLDRYFEFQISPLGQHFELEVLEPRKRTNADYRSGFKKRAVRVSDDAWTATFQIPWTALGWPSEHKGARTVRGNAFAILGSSESRSYWSLFTPPQETPDFHRPQEFGELLRVTL